jgi:NADP-dependent 3-hydroxy acid dehydrogenase YdfG
MEHTARMAPRSWLITGASSGLGNAFARAALGAGDLVTATARRPEALAGLTRRFPGRVTWSCRTCGPAAAGPSSRSAA